MDHNELRGAHQIALMKADAATDRDQRLRHLEDAAVISGIVSRMKAARGGGDFSSPGTASLSPSARGPRAPREAVSDWEAEGGALAAASPPYAIQNKVPPIKVRTVVEFSVGAYRYASITDALAQQVRIARSFASLHHH